MANKRFLNPHLTRTGRSGKGTGRGGRQGAKHDGGDPEDPSWQDFERLAKMLGRVSETLERLINSTPSVLDHALQEEFIRTWPRAGNNLARAIERLHEEAILHRTQFPEKSRLRGQLQRAGLCGDMLRMKEVSLNFYLNPVDEIVTEPLTNKESIGERVITKLLTWTKPAFKVMNSILGSLLKAFPGMEVVKELKEHVEAGYEIAEAKQEDR